MKNGKVFASETTHNTSRLIGLVLFTVLAGSLVASAQQWKAAPTFPGSGGASTAILLTDGTVMVQEAGPGGAVSDTGNWFLLVPNSLGSYSDGQWQSMNSMETNWDPHFYASAVMTTGKVLFLGGEYENNNQTPVDSNVGAIFGPTGTSTFTRLSTGPGWTLIGDAASVVLPNGKLMVGNCCNNQQALFDPNKLTWTLTGPGKLDNNSEEGWTLLPNGKVLTIDTQSLDSKGNETAELYSYQTGTWSRTGSLPPHNSLSNRCFGVNTVPELGPSVLRPDGTVWATGANGLTAIYNYKTDKWTPGPVFPPSSAGGQDGVCDGPAAVLPNGRALVMTSRINNNSAGNPPADFYEFDGTTINSIPGPPNAPNDASFYGRMLVLPTGNILFTDGSQDVEIFEPADTTFNNAWQPTVTSFPATVTPGHHYVIKGTQFTGLTQGAYYGDDAQAATNFPLVRLTVDGGALNGEVFYARTYNLPSGVATGTKIVQCTFVVPSSMPQGSARLEVVANGIPSNPVMVTIE